MKYFIDTEFIEGVQVGWFKRTKPTIDLISIGIVAEDNREYYAISNEFNLMEAWTRFDIKNNEKIFWIRDNVLKPIYYAETSKNFDYANFKKFLEKHGKPNVQIAEEIKEFCKDAPITVKQIGISEYKLGKPTVKENIGETTTISRGKPKFYGWYSDYDWVVFCWLFGRMRDLPKGFPHYCYDIQQLFDEKKKQIKGLIKEQEGYPHNSNAHNALSDAIFHKKLYYFLNSL